MSAPAWDRHPERQRRRQPVKAVCTDPKTGLRLAVDELSTLGRYTVMVTGKLAGHTVYVHSEDPFSFPSFEAAEAAAIEIASELDLAGVRP